MFQDLRSIIHKTADFLGKKLNEQQIDTLLHHLSFESMKNNRAVNYEPVIEINKKYNLIEESGNFMRCGKVGEWKETMGPKLIEQFEKWDEENLKDTGLKFF